MHDAEQSLATLQSQVRAGDTRSMPLSGLIVWSLGAVAGLFLDEVTFAYAVLFGSGALFPLGVLISRLRGHNMLSDGAGNPLTNLFLLNIVIVAAIWPIAIVGSQGGQPLLIVVYAAVMLGMIWIPWGWSADDPVGLRHAIGRGLASYAAFYLVPSPYTASAICAVVVLAYAYSLAFMRRG